MKFGVANKYGIFRGQQVVCCDSWYRLWQCGTGHMVQIINISIVQALISWKWRLQLTICFARLQIQTPKLHLFIIMLYHPQSVPHSLFYLMNLSKTKAWFNLFNTDTLSISKINIHPYNLVNSISYIASWYFIRN